MQQDWRDITVNQSTTSALQEVWKRIRTSIQPVLQPPKTSLLERGDVNICLNYDLVSILSALERVEYVVKTVSSLRLDRTL
jgi:hypothetical protein